MIMNEHFPFLNFLLGTIFLTVLFHYSLSLSWENCFLFGVILSLLYTSAAHVFLKRSYNRWKESQFFKSLAVRYVLFFVISFGFGVLLFGLVYIAFAKPGTSFIPLVEMLGVLFIIGASVLFLVAILHERDKKTPEKVVYSWRNFLKELSASLLVFTITYFSGISLEKSVSMALYIFVLAGWYYSMMAHKYVISDRILKIRAVVNFVVVASGIYLFVSDSIVISGLSGALFAVASEKDYNITRKLVEEGLLERKYAESGAGGLFYGISYGIGVIVAFMIVMGDYSALFIRESLLTVFRLLYLFTTIFLPFGTLLGWLRLRIHTV